MTKDLKLFGIDLPKVHSDEVGEGDSLVSLLGHNAQQLLVDLSRAMQHKDARIVSQYP